jgi:RHS repeat-associated protein
MTNATGTAYRYYVPAGNNVIVYNRWSTGSNPIYYITQDHLGSTAAITDQSGALVVSEKFAALGWNENTSAQEATMATVTRHEFTGQEGLDNAGIWTVNMNGRVYNPSGGMFLSPDPNIPDPSNTLSYNRYAYVNYNPLTYTDPTGFEPTCDDTEGPCGPNWGIGSPPAGAGDWDNTDGGTCTLGGDGVYDCGTDIVWGRQQGQPSNSNPPISPGEGSAIGFADSGGGFSGGPSAAGPGAPSTSGPGGPLGGQSWVPAPTVTLSGVLGFFTPSTSIGNLAAAFGRKSWGGYGTNPVTGDEVSPRDALPNFLLSIVPNSDWPR